MKINLDSFLSVIKQSGLIEPSRLDGLVAQCRSALAQRRAAELGSADSETDTAVAVKLDAKTLATFLVKSGELTTWQAEKLLLGKHKGFTLGKYKLLSLLGKGGMSSVYLAEHTLMKRRVAVKVLPHKRVNDASYLGRFHREAQAVASLDHPNIVRAYDVDHEVDKSMQIHFLVMEYVRGRSLQEIIAQDGPMDPVLAAEYIRQAAEGLEHAHQNGLVHRDIKPGNLLVETTGTVKLLDLGLARFFDDSEESLTIEHDEKVLGTADYLAPEQAVDSHMVDHRADIYSLGCTLYFLLTGGPPFTEGSLAQRLIAHQTKEPPPLAAARDDIPPALDAIVRRLMSKKPEDRPQTAADAAAILAGFLAEHGGGTPATAAAAAVEPPVEAELDDFFNDLEDRSGVGSGSLVGPAARIGGRGRRGKSSRKLTGRGSGTDAGGVSAVDDSGTANTVVSGSSATDVAGADQPAPPSSRRITREKTKPPIALIAAGLAAVAVAGLLFALLSGGDEPASVDPSAPVADADAPTADPSADAVVVTKPERPTPDGDVFRVAADPSAPFGTIADALEWAKLDGRADLTLELAPGERYAERLSLRSGIGGLPDGLTIRTADGGEPATIAAPDDGQAGPIVDLQGVSGYTLADLAIDAAGQRIGLRAGGFAKSTRIENVAVGGFSEAGIVVDEVVAFPDQRLVLERCRVDGAAGTDLVRVRADSLASSQIRITNGRFIGPIDGDRAAVGLRVSGDVDQLDVQRNVIAGCETAVLVDRGPSVLIGLKLNNNTVFACDRGMLFEHMPKTTSRSMNITRNLFARIDGPELAARGAAAEEFLKLVEWKGGNLSTRQPDSAAPGEIDLFEGGKRRTDTVGFLSTDPSSGEFLKSKDQKIRIDYDPKFIGGVPPW